MDSASGEDLMRDEQLDHVVIKVDSLEQASKNFTQLGFLVTPGGSHGFTHNALIVFKDNTYIELLAVRGRLLGWALRLSHLVGLLQLIAGTRTDIYKRLLLWLGARPGPLDWCIRVKNIERTRLQWTQHGLECLESKRFQRELPDGGTADWFLGGCATQSLPFVLQDISAHAIRVPTMEFAHPNGATGLHCVLVKAKRSPKVHSRLRSIFRSAPYDDDRATELFFAGSTTAKVHHKSLLHGIFALELDCDGAKTTQLDPGKTYGTSIILTAPD